MRSPQPALLQQQWASPAAPLTPLLAEQAALSARLLQLPYRQTQRRGRPTAPPTPKRLLRPRQASPPADPTGLWRPALGGPLGPPLGGQGSAGGHICLC